MWALLVTRTTSGRYSGSCRVLRNANNHDRIRDPLLHVITSGNWLLVNNAHYKTPREQVQCLLFRPTSAQYINSNVYFVQHSDSFRCMYIITLSQSFPLYVKVTKSIKLIKLKCLHGLLLQIINRLYSLKTLYNVSSCYKRST